MNDDLPPRDHNRPPEQLPLDRAAELIAAANEGLRTIKRIDDAETAGRCQGFVDQLREVKADLEQERRERLEPLQAAVDLVRMNYREPLDLIELAREGLQPLLDDYLERQAAALTGERERLIQVARLAQANADRLRRQAELPGASLQQQLEARRAQERADDAADKARKANTRAQIKGEWSDKAMTQHARWHAEITDAAKALQHYADRQEVADVVKKLASADARRLKNAQAAPPGVRFIRKNKAQ